MISKKSWNKLHQWSITTAPLIALGVLAACIIACRASWSPDGSKILFPFPSYENKIEKMGLAIYDLQTNTTKHIFSVTGKDFQLAGKWLPNGKKVLAFVEKKKVLSVRVIDLQTQQNSLLATVDGLEEMSSVALDHPIIGEHMFLGGKKYFRINLKTGNVKSRKTTKEIYFCAANNQLYFVALSKNLCIFGKMDQNELKPVPVLELPKKQWGGISPWFAVASDQSHVAIVGTKKKKQKTLYIFANNKLQKSLDFTNVTLGNLQWAPNAKTLYTSFVKSGEHGVCVITGKGKINYIPLFVAKSKSFFQIDLSPDGKRIVASSAFIEKLAQKDRALYIVDLENKNKVSKIPVPLYKK